MKSSSSLPSHDTQAQRDMTQLGGSSFGGDHAAAVLIAATVVFGCLAFGGTEPWAGAVMQIAIGAIGIVWCIAGKRGARVLLVLSLPAAVGLLQIMSLSENALGLLAPFSFRARDTLRLIGIKPGSWSVSVDPGATTLSVVWGFSLAVVVAAVACASRSAAARKIIVGAVAITGAAVLLVGVITVKAPPYVALGHHNMTGPLRPWKNPLLNPLHSAGMGYPDLVQVGQIHSGVPTPVVGDVFGPYVNSNHFAGCIGLTLPLALALLLLVPTNSLLKRRLFMGMTTIYALGAVAVLLAGARAYGGALSLIIAGLVVGVIAIQKKRSRIIAAALLTLLVLACIAGLFFMVASTGKPGDGQSAASTQGSSALGSSAKHRIVAWRAAWEMGTANTAFGTGFGTYGKCYPLFADTPPVMYFAHNDYAQLFAETGLIGVVAALIALGFICRWIARSLRNAEGRHTRIILLGAIGGLVAIGVHSALDYNLHIPANAFLAAVLLGLAIGPGLTATRATTATKPQPMSQYLAWGLRLATIAILIISSFGAIGRASVEARAMSLRLALVEQRRKEPSTTPDQRRYLLKQSLAATHASSQALPIDASTAILMAQANLYLAHGRPSLELHESRKWLLHGLALCPVEGYWRLTLLGVEQELAIATSRGMDWAAMAPFIPLSREAQKAFGQMQDR
jgi:O-Antigen ligase